MFLALHEIRRGLVRFGLLAMAIGLLLFLVLFQQALQDGLLTSFVGALRNQSAPVLVYAIDGQRTLQGSVLTPDLESAILAVDGVGKHGRLGQGTFTTVVNDAEATDTAVIGTDNELGQPTALAAGRRPAAAGEAIGSSADFAVGDSVAVTARGEPVTLAVVGVADDVQLSVTPTLFTTFDTYADTVRSVNPDAADIPANALAVAPVDGVTPEQLAARINDVVADADAVTRQEAADTTPGVAQVRQSFRVIFAALRAGRAPGDRVVLPHRHPAEVPLAGPAAGHRRPDRCARHGPGRPSAGDHRRRCGHRRGTRLAPRRAPDRRADAAFRPDDGDRMGGAVPRPRPHRHRRIVAPSGAHRPVGSDHDRGSFMRLAMRELRRRPGRFVAATAILGALAVLLMFLGGLLDGLLASSTGAYRAQQADLIVYSTDARDSLPRSRLDPAVRSAVESVDGVAATGGLGSVQLGARPADQPDSRELLATALIGYELAPTGVPDQPPPTGQAIADDSIRSDGVRSGDVLLLGPARTPVEVVGFVSDTQFSGQATLWASIDTWRAVTAANRPAETFADQSVQALVVRTDEPADEVAAAIDAATDGATTTLTKTAAIDAIPGVAQQRSTFNQIIGVTALVAVVVVALFFALITVERIGLYGVLKAIGASSRTLFGGVVAQAVVLAIVASLLGVGGSLVLDAVIPPGSIPFEVTTGRLVASGLLMLAAAIVGSAFSLRRVLRIDPAAAIGAAS